MTESRFEANSALLDEFGIQQKSAMEGLSTSIFMTTLDSLLLRQKLYLQAILITTIQERVYNLKKSDWHPEQPIGNLIGQLQTYGPHVVSGRIGRGFYEDLPFQPKNNETQQPVTIQGRPVFGWKPNSKPKDPDSLHTVVIVGAEITKRVSNASISSIPMMVQSPADITSQKLYVFL